MARANLADPSGPNFGMRRVLLCPATGALATTTIDTNSGGWGTGSVGGGVAGDSVVIMMIMLLMIAVSLLAQLCALAIYVLLASREQYV